MNKASQAKRLNIVVYSYFTASLVLSLAILPLSMQYRNPPYHRFQGLDLHGFILATTFFTANLCLVVLVIWRTRTDRLFLAAALCAFLFCLVRLIVEFLSSAAQPSIL